MSTSSANTPDTDTSNSTPPYPKVTYKLWIAVERLIQYGPNVEDHEVYEDIEDPDISSVGPFNSLSEALFIANQLADFGNEIDPADDFPPEQWTLCAQCNTAEYRPNLINGLCSTCAPD